MSTPTPRKIVLANLKAYRAPAQVEQWFDNFVAQLRTTPDGVEVVLALPDMALEQVADKSKTIAGISLAAQALSPFPQGSYTGSTPAAWLRGLVRYSLAGHRERRVYFQETAQDVARQAHEALEEEITPIVCVEGEQFHKQLAAFSYEERERLIWAFTPKIETALVLPRDLQVITDAIAKIAQVSGNRPVLYGSGINAQNINTIWALPGLSGILVAEASRDAKAFAGMIQRLG